MAATVKYSEAIDLQKGEALMVFIGDTPIAYSTSHELSFVVGTEDVSSKMSGDYDSSLPGKISWQISIESLVSVTTGHLSKLAIITTAAKRKPIKLEICTVTRGVETDGSKTFTKGAVDMKGEGIITDCNEKSNNGEYATFSCTIKGVGPLMDSAGKPLGTTSVGV